MLKELLSSNNISTFPNGPINFGPFFYYKLDGFIVLNSLNWYNIYMKLIPYILITIGTIGLLIVEFTSESRSLTLTFAVFNVFGLILLAFKRKKS